MTTNTNVTQKAARRKLNLLELAQELDNVSKACMIMGYSRQQFYEIRRNFQTYGAEGLLDKIPGAKGPHPNRVSEDVEKAILDYSAIAGLRILQLKIQHNTEKTPEMTPYPPEAFKAQGTR